MAIVQAKILDAILHCGGIATTQEIKKLTGLGRTNIWMACTHLVSRYMITKDIKIKKDYGLPPKKIIRYKLRDNQIHRIKREIAQLENVR